MDHHIQSQPLGSWGLFSKHCPQIPELSNYSRMAPSIYSLAEVPQLDMGLCKIQVESQVLGFHSLNRN